MDKTIKIENESAVNFLESLAYEVNARKDLLAYMLQNGTKPEDENFQAYHKEYQEFFVHKRTLDLSPPLQVGGLENIKNLVRSSFRRMP